MRKVEITNLEDERTHRTVIVASGAPGETVSELAIIEPGRSAIVDIPDNGRVRLTDRHLAEADPEEISQQVDFREVVREGLTIEDLVTPASAEPLDSDGGTGSGSLMENPYAGIGARLLSKLKGTPD